MFPLKFRISTKLALSAVCGVAVVAGMIVNDRLATEARRQATRQLADASPTPPTRRSA